MSSEGVRQGGTAHQKLSRSFQASSRVIPQSAESWLSSLSSSRWCEVWAHPLPGIRMTPLLLISPSDRRVTWWSWACLRDRNNETKAREGREGEQGREDNHYQMKSPDRETAPGKLQGFYISTSAVSFAITICSFKSYLVPVASPSQTWCQYKQQRTILPLLISNICQSY